MDDMKTNIDVDWCTGVHGMCEQRKKGKERKGKEGEP